MIGKLLCKLGFHKIPPNITETKGIWSGTRLGYWMPCPRCGAPSACERDSRAS